VIAGSLHYVDTVSQAEGHICRRDIVGGKKGPMEGEEGT